MPNKSDAPMQSRMVVIEFEPLECSEANDVERWNELKYTFSAIAPDIHDLFLMHDGKLNKQALDDCAKRFTQMDDLRRRAEARGSATRVVVYEDLAADRGRFDDLRAFLVEGLDVNRSGCDAHPRKEAVQIHDRPTSTYVSNLDDVRATVAASPYAYLLDRPEEQGT